MGLTAANVSVKKEGRTPTGGGGKTVSLVDVATGLLATKNFYTRQSLLRDEGNMVGSGPGIVQQTHVLFKFERADNPTPFPSIKRNYRVVEADGTIWMALYDAREYDMTVQVDCERVDQ